MHLHFGGRIAIAASFFPSRSVTTIMSADMNPLQTLFGVISSRFASRRTLMFPSFDAV